MTRSRESRADYPAATVCDLIETQVKQLRRTVEHLASEITNLRTEMARLRHMPAPPDAADAAGQEAAQTEAAPPATSLLERVSPDTATDDDAPRDTPLTWIRTSSTSPSASSTCAR